MTDRSALDAAIDAARHASALQDATAIDADGTEAWLAAHEATRRAWARVTAERAALWAASPAGPWATPQDHAIAEAFGW